MSENKADRRTFIKTSAGAAAAVALAGTVPQSQAAEKSVMRDGIHVYDEFGELKEVVLGSPLTEEDLLPEWDPGFDEEFSHAKPETLVFLKGYAGKPWKEANPELFNKINSQLAAYIGAVEKHGVKVRHFPDPVHKDRDYINRGVERIWPRDVFCTAGDTVAVSSLRIPWKRKQQFTALPLYSKLMLADKCKFISTPQASTEILSPPKRKYKAEESSILLDGGDFLVNGEEIYLGIGHGSNMLGAKFAETVWGDEFKIYPLKMDTGALHLDCAMSLLRPGLGLICRDWIKSELPPRLKEYKWIETTVEEAQWLGCNGLPLDPETTIIDSRHKRVIAEVRKAGHNVIELPYDGPSFIGGAFRCSSQPLYRAKA